MAIVRLKGEALDAAVAAFAALAVAFALLVMPGEFFMGFDALGRLPIALTVAGATFGLLVALLRQIGRSPREAVPSADVQVPRLRRADAHPDAPPRMPLSVLELATLEAPEPVKVDRLDAKTTPAAEPEPTEPPLRGDETVAELMQRLEQVLGRNEIANRSPDSSSLAPPENRLREAIVELQLLSARR